MPYPYFFCSRTAAGTAFFLLAILPTLSTAAEPSEAASPLSMYFDDSQMVEVATRAPKPLRQVAESVSIITAEEIRDMHVHTLLEVLERQPGVSVAYNGADYGSVGSFYLQGTEWRHTLVLIDGVRINNASAGEALVN
ncbi:MAG TPA: TonB-dependent receptor plug domain-containing protein, partial [Desulfurivibrionaceae bacterium]